MDEVDSKLPGASKRCTCYTFLQLLHDHPNGPFTDIFSDWRSAGGYGVCDAVQSNFVIRWHWCPMCGGRLGKYRPELADAYRRYRTALAGVYAPLLSGRQDREAFQRAAEAAGAAVVRDSGYQLELRDAAAAISLTVSWDPDHDCHYGFAEFSPEEKWQQDPFLPNPE